MVAMQAMESPEAWFEDFGSGQLTAGEATISLDKTFLETVSVAEGYHVFLTPTGESQGLYVTQKTPTTFVVKESSGGKSSVSFDYRIVAHRKGYEKDRFYVVPVQPQAKK